MDDDVFQEGGQKRSPYVTRCVSPESSGTAQDVRVRSVFGAEYVGQKLLTAGWQSLARHDVLKKCLD
jgi:hypothetical protein